ncbi:MAG: hypothetical protein K0Q53_103 [Massilibacillus sp.]|jgi:hypothetical protein|nr:hypothetical protein [Massilibacillus sp.]
MPKFAIYPPLETGYFILSAKSREDAVKVVMYDYDYNYFQIQEVTPNMVPLNEKHFDNGTMYTEQQDGTYKELCTISGCVITFKN